MPKPSTTDKYQLKDEEIKECMEEVVLCQPSEKVFYKKGRCWLCPCNKRNDRCLNPECKILGAQLGLKVGSSMCEHSRIRSECKECGGSQICEHSRRRSRCKECGGSYICEHSRQRIHCKICDLQGYLIKLRRSRRSRVIKSSNPTHTLADLCMTTKEWVKYLNKTFEDRYGRPITDNDDVHIDEIIPCFAWNLPEDNKYCWHYLNSQRLLDKDNLSKGKSYKEEDKLAMIERIQSSLYTSSSEMG